jgi:hypothetical protein
MRSLLLLPLCLILIGAAAPGGTPTFKRVWPQYRDADSFQSFYEYHTGRELIGKWTLLRSQPAHRGGYYFYTRVENPGEAMNGATFVVRVIAPDSTATRIYRFPADVPKGSRLFEIGLTGSDWLGARINPVAWQVELQAPDGKVLTAQSSFLWASQGE